MARSYPIWNKVVSCSYKSDKSYGNKNVGETSIYCGSSAANSELLAETVVTRVVKSHKKYGDIIVFKAGMNGTIMSIAVFKNKGNGAAGELIKLIKKKNLKSLTI